MKAEGCREWRERIGALLLGQLSEEERFATEAHLDGCPALPRRGRDPRPSRLDAGARRSRPFGARARAAFTSPRAGLQPDRGRAPRRTPQANPRQAWIGGRHRGGRHGRGGRRRRPDRLGSQHPHRDGGLPGAAQGCVRRGHPRTPSVGKRDRHEGIRLPAGRFVPGVAAPLRRQTSACRVVSLCLRRRGRTPQRRPAALCRHRDRLPDRFQDLRGPPALPLRGRGCLAPPAPRSKEDT